MINFWWGMMLQKMKSSQLQLEEDETIDTNVMFDQQEPQSNLSKSCVLGPPASILQNAHNTSMLSRAHTFSGVNAKSSSSPDDLQHVQLSTSHRKHLKFSASMPHQQVGEIGSPSQSSFDSTSPSLQDDNDLFPTKESIIPGYNNSSTTMHPGLRKKKKLSPSVHFESKNISATSTTQLPIIGARGEKKLLPISTNSQTSPRLMQAPLPQGASENNDVVEDTTPQGHKVELKEVVDPQALLVSKYFRGRLNDSWDLMPQQLGHGSISPMLVTMPMTTKAKTNARLDPHGEVGAIRTGKNINIIFIVKMIFFLDNTLNEHVLLFVMLLLF